MEDLYIRLRYKFTSIWNYMVERPIATVVGLVLTIVVLGIVGVFL